MTLEENQFDDNKLISMVDERFEKNTFRIIKLRKAGFYYYAKFFMVIYFLAIFAVVGYLLWLIAQALPAMASQPINSQLAVAIAITSAFIALASLGVNIQKLAEPENTPKILAQYNYKMLRPEVENEHKEKLALLKALVILKSKQPEVRLRQFLQTPIPNDKVFEVLYTNNFSLD